MKEWLEKHAIGWDDCAYMGDDVHDYAVMKKVGLAAAPAQAEDVVKEISDFIAPRNGGDGAIRDLVNLIVKAKNIDPTSLELPL